MGDMGAMDITTRKNKVLELAGLIIDEKSSQIEIKRDAQSNPPDTIWGVVEEIMRLDRNGPEFKFLVTAKIKRLIHFEKLDLLSRLKFYGEDSAEYGMSVIKEKIQTHREWSQKSDKDIVTWKV